MSINIRHVGDALIRFVKKKLEFTVVRRAQYLYYKHEQEHGYRIDKNADLVFLDTLRRINSGLEEPYFVTGQSGYFTERIEREGLGDLTLEKEDQEIVDFIIDCFHHRHDMKFKASSIPFFSSTLMGTVEYNYGTQSFPAGIEENVFLCSVTHVWPILPRVGEKEEDFYIRILEYQIERSETFDMTKKDEVLRKARILVEKFCKHKNRIWFFKMKDILHYKVSEGDDEKIKYGDLTIEEKKKRIEGFPTMKEFYEQHNIYDIERMYRTTWGTDEFGMTIYGVIPYKKLRYIEVERRYQSLQRIARSLGYQEGEEISLDLLERARKSDGKQHNNSKK